MTITSGSRVKTKFEIRDIHGYSPCGAGTELIVRKIYTTEYLVVSKPDSLNNSFMVHVNEVEAV